MTIQQQARPQQSDETAVTLENSFRATMRKFPAAVSVITVATPDGPHGMTASSVTSVSLNPPTILVSLDHRSRTRELLQTEDKFTINLLSERQHQIAEDFSSRSISDPFSKHAWTASGTNGCALLDDAPAQINCTVVDRIDVADHTLVIAAVSHASVHETDAKPLIHFEHRFHGVTDLRT